MRRLRARSCASREAHPRRSQLPGRISPKRKRSRHRHRKRRSSSYPVAVAYFSANPPIVLTQIRLADDGRQVVGRSGRSRCVRAATAWESSAVSGGLRCSHNCLQRLNRGSQSVATVGPRCGSTIAARVEPSLSSFPRTAKRSTIRNQGNRGRVAGRVDDNLRACVEVHRKRQGELLALNRGHDVYRTRPIVD